MEPVGSILKLIGKWDDEPRNNAMGCECQIGWCLLPGRLMSTRMMHADHPFCILNKETGHEYQVPIVMIVCETGSPLTNTFSE